MSKIFISYSREDRAMADRLYRDLEAAGFQLWLDRVDLAGGERWKHRITEEIRESKYFIALLSSRGLGTRGYVQKEIRLALDVLDEYPIEERFFVPVRLEECEPRDQRLLDLQWVDLFPDYESGLQDLFRALGGRPVGEARLVRDERAEIYPEVLRLAMKVYEGATGYAVVAKERKGHLGPMAEEIWAGVKRDSDRLFELREKIDVLSAEEVRTAAGEIIAFATKVKTLGLVVVVKDTKAEMEALFQEYVKELRPAFLRVTREELQGK